MQQILHEKASVWIECTFDEFGEEFPKDTATVDASFFQTNIIDHLHTESCT